MTAQQALKLSYLDFGQVIHQIKIRAMNRETCLPYVMVNPEDVPKLRELGYVVFENVGTGDQTTIHWGEAIKRGSKKDRGNSNRFL